MKNHRTLITVCTISVLFLAACQQPSVNGTQTASKSGAQTSTTGEKVYSPNMDKCAGFTADDASTISGVPAAELKTTIEMQYEGFWHCSFVTDDYKGVAFYVTVGKSVEEAINDMESYRQNLEVAAGLPQFQDEENGAYSDIVGNGFEGIWTTINGTLNARKGNISIQVSLPTEKLDQVKVADAFFSKL